MKIAHLQAVPSSGRPDFNQVADELYSGPPEEFTAARSRYERQAKQAGDRDLAARIHSLPKPSVTAWLANQLTRQDGDELRPLLELGSDLREATRTLAGAQLRELSRRQRDLVYALVQQCRQIARDAGRSVSDDTARGLQDILHAALADEQVADLLLAGRLTVTVRRSGLGDVDSFDSESSETSPPSKAPAAGKRTSAHDRRAEQLQHAERELAKAADVLSEATREHNQAQGRAAEADQILTDAVERVEQLQQQLADAAAQQASAERDRRTLHRAVERADQALRRAQHRQNQAADTRDRLATPE